MIADTSVWIEFFHGVKTPRVNAFRAGLQNQQVFVCPVIVQELLQGVRDNAQFDKLKEGLSAVPMLDAQMWDASVGAASIYRKLRKHGITVRKPNDCLIAWYAIAFDLPLLHFDKDFDLMTTHVPLKVLKVE
jgi:predicted nucleic acid-binding protein